MGYTIAQLQTKVLISYSGNTTESCAVDPCLNVIAGNTDERVIYISTSGTNQGLSQFSVAHFPYDDIDSCLTFDGVELAPFASRNEAIRTLANYVFSCESSKIVAFLPPQDPDNPFEYGDDDGRFFRIKSTFTNTDPQESMFKFDPYPTNLVENTLVTEDLFFFRLGNDIILKTI